MTAVAAINGMRKLNFIIGLIYISLLKNNMVRISTLFQILL